MKKKNRSLDECIGKSWMYKSNTYKFLSVNQEGTRYTIATETKWLSVQERDLKGFLEELLPVEDEILPANVNGSSAIISDTMRNNVKSLSDILKDNIKRLQEDPSYVKQAQQINNASKTMLDLARLELDVHKEMKKSK